MLYEVEIVKKHPGFTEGEVKQLTYDNALHLKKMGIAEILGPVVSANTKDIDKAISEQDEKQNAKIAELEERIAKLEKLSLKQTKASKEVIDPKAKKSE